MQEHARPPALASQKAPWWRTPYLIIALLLTQVGAFFYSMDEAEISIFCTGASEFVPGASLPLAYAFGTLHMLFAALFLLGLGSLFAPRLRLIYLTMTLIGLCFLPVQNSLVSAHKLTCDSP